ncbi:unnamed protein product [Adineta steineri]|uniref:Kinesin-like protein n=1 Tax=Adineta steineri TaxID=433720 RepID=A0A813MZ17_9BILA|nr:unnamed protein product [Adineta steineri]CAF0756809.1 unnamed protein product [Adineta steineri]CAF3512274.1 unnamed protein product [Adineta steineri]CAF3531513.1 unnamed protein product [Adineta steineri]
MSYNHQQYLSCLHVGQPVNIQRSNGRIHQAMIKKINHTVQTITVEWEEKNEGKGKEVDLDAIIKINPDLFTTITNAGSRAGAISHDISTDHEDNSTTIDHNNATHPNRRTHKKDEKRQSHSLSQSRTGRISTINEVSPQRQQNASTDPIKSKVVKEIERIAANREQRRVKHEKHRRKLSEVDHSIPAWEFQAMINEYRQQLGMKYITMNEQQKDLRITVCVRKRPITKKELNKKDIDVLTIPNKDHVVIHLPKVKLDLAKYIDNQTFRFDYSMHELCDNELVYHFTAQPLVRSLFQGCNPLVFAYGQTGSGKTYTMGGDLSQRDVDFSKGIYALTANDIFHHLNNSQHRGQYDVYCTFFEIYCTKVFDLFNDKKRLRVLEDHKNLVQVVGKKEERVETVHDVMSLIRRGMSVRTSGTTSANEHSSRSHAVFQITLKKKNTTKEYGKISLIDLAGSERGRDTQTNDKVTLMEGAQINKSLLTLKECIRALGRNAEHIPFRGSTLTKVLRDSFIGEKCKICMIAMVSPGSSDVDHTLNTLRYADRVKELNVDELKQRGVELHQKHTHDDLHTADEDDYDDDVDEDEFLNESSTQVIPPSHTHLSKPHPQQHNLSKSLLKSQQSKRKFEQAIARSHELEDLTLESHHGYIDEFPQMLASHQTIFDSSTLMNYDREKYAKQLIHLIDSQQQHLTKLRNKALQMREAVAHENLCAKDLTFK